MSKKQFISLLKMAHAGEIGAARAYISHKHATKNKFEKEKIGEILNEELAHILAVKEMLAGLGHNSNWFLDRLFWFIGFIAGMLCHVTGKRGPLIGAKMMETVGVVNYNKMADMAEELGYVEFAEELSIMAETEKDHERFFQRRLYAL